MTQTDTPLSETTSAVKPDRFETLPATVIAGLQERYTFENMNHIPALWARFAPSIGTLPEQVGEATYGVIVTTPDGKGIEYLAGVEVSDAAPLLTEFSTMEIPAQRYAVFAHPGNVSNLCETVDAVFHKWLPSSGHELTLTPEFFERYGEKYNPETGTGDIEMWVPVKG
jgi:AraC family transcriptional regulator